MSRYPCDSFLKWYIKALTDSLESGYTCAKFLNPVIGGQVLTEEYRLVTQKTISGKATLKLNLEEGDKARSLVVYSRVVRFPKSDYLNKRYEPNRSRYGNILFEKDKFVLSYFPIEFAKQRFSFIQDAAGEVMLQLACINQEILQSLANLAIALGLTPISIENETKDWKPLDFSPDTLQVVCENDTALDIAIYVLDYDDCEELPEPRPEPKDPPEPPPPKRLPVDPGDPIEVDPPEDDDTEDTFDPFPGDEPEQPPERTCDLVRVLIIGYRASDDVAESTNNIFIFGDLIDVRLTEDASSFGFEAYGGPIFTGTCTVEPTFITLVSGYPAGFFGRVTVELL